MPSRCLPATVTVVRDAERRTLKAVPVATTSSLPEITENGRLVSWCTAANTSPCSRSTRRSFGPMVTATRVPPPSVSTEPSASFCTVLMPMGDVNWLVSTVSRVLFHHAVPAMPAIPTPASDATSARREKVAAALWCSAFARNLSGDFPDGCDLVEGLLVQRIALAPVQPRIHDAIVLSRCAHALQPQRGLLHALQVRVLESDALRHHAAPALSRDRASSGAAPSRRRRQYMSARVT